MQRIYSTSDLKAATLLASLFAGGTVHTIVHPTITLYEVHIFKSVPSDSIRPTFIKFYELAKDL